MVVRLVEFSTIGHFDKSMSIKIFGFTKNHLKHTKEDGAKGEGSFELDISSRMELDKEREVEVTMFFGRSSIEVIAQGKNFASGKTLHIIPVTFK